MHGLVHLTNTLFFTFSFNLQFVVEVQQLTLQLFKKWNRIVQCKLKFIWYPANSNLSHKL